MRVMHTKGRKRKERESVRVSKIGKAASRQDKARQDKPKGLKGVGKTKSNGKKGVEVVSCTRQDTLTG